jgi:hypothetical protein
LKLFQEWGGGGEREIKEMMEGDEFNYDIL